MTLHSILIRQFGKIGSCSICMRQALLSAVAAWTCWGLTSFSGVPAVLVTVAFVAAIGLSSLWLLHVLVYVLRSLAWRQTAAWKQAGKSGPDVSFRRRGALVTVARASAVAALVSMPALLLPTKAMAFCGQCTKDADCGSSGSNWCCKNTAPVNAGYVCNECKKCV